MNIERTKITGKGQIQLPVKIRNAIGAKIGDELAFILNDKGQVRLQLIKKRKLSDFAGILRTRKRFPGIEEEEEITRKKIAQKVAREHEQE